MVDKRKDKLESIPMDFCRKAVGKSKVQRVTYNTIRRLLKVPHIIIEEIKISNKNATDMYKECRKIEERRNNSLKLLLA